MKKLFLLLFLSIGTAIFAQNQLNFESGNLNFLKGQTEINVQMMKFENVTFQADNYTEEAYLEKRKTETIAKKGEASWEKWIGNWEKFKATEYLDYFLKGANAKSKKITFKKDASTKYTVIIETKWIYAGWHGGLIGQEGKLTSILTFVESDNPSKILAKIKGDQILGKPQNKDFVMEYGRIAGAYEATGKEIGKAVKNATK